MAATGTNRWKLGLFVVLGVAVALGALIWLGNAQFGRETFSAVTYFDESVQGLDVGSPVKFRGVTIGSVTDIEIAPDGRHVEVTMEIEKPVLPKLGIADVYTAQAQGRDFVPPGLRVQLVTAGITGVKFLQVDFFDPKKYPAPELPFPVPPSYFPSAPSTLKSLEESVMETLEKLPELSDTATRMLAEAQVTLMSLREVIETLGASNGPLVSVLHSVEQSSANLSQAVENARLGETTKSVREAASSVGSAAQTMNGAAKDIRGLTDELQEDLVTLRRTLDAARSLVDLLERDPAALLRGRSHSAPPPPAPAAPAESKHD